MSEPLALVIDDEPDICELLSLTLGRMNINTETAADVAGAKRLLGGKKFDLCLTDMRLPDGDGLALAHALLTDGSVGRAVFFTGTADPERIARATPLGPLVNKSSGVQSLHDVVLRELVHQTVRKRLFGG